MNPRHDRVIRFGPSISKAKQKSGFITLVFAYIVVGHVIVPWMLLNLWIWTHNALTRRRTPDLTHLFAGMLAFNKTPAQRETIERLERAGYREDLGWYGHVDMPCRQMRKIDSDTITIVYPTGATKEMYMPERRKKVKAVAPVAPPVLPRSNVSSTLAGAEGPPFTPHQKWVINHLKLTTPVEICFEKDSDGSVEFWPQGADKTINNSGTIFPSGSVVWSNGELVPYPATK